MYNNNVHWNQPWFRSEDDIRNVQNACGKYMNYHVLGQMQDGSQVEGILEGMDDQGVTIMVPEEVEDQPQDSRVYGFGLGYGGYGGYPRRRFRRYRRRRFPYATFVFPFIVPFPYYY